MGNHHMTKNSVMSIWLKLVDKPFGKTIFSKIICWKAPYFGSIKPRFVELRGGYAHVTMPKRRAVHNHIQTIHAIALCNLAEIGAGTMMEASLAPTMRWLPKGMTVQYLKKAETNIDAYCVAPEVENGGEGVARDVVVHVEIKDKQQNVVTIADITMWVSPKKARD